MTEFIIRYENVFSKGDCSRLISYIDEFESNNLLFHDKNKLHQQKFIMIVINRNYNYFFFPWFP